MASASSSAQAAFGLGRRKKNPGLLDQIGKFFGGDKKRKSKVRREAEGRGGGRDPLLRRLLVSSNQRGADYLCFFLLLFCFVFTVNLFLLLSLKDLSHYVTDEGAGRHRLMTLGAGLFSFVFICFRHVGSFGGVEGGG